jgi:hypothetical protein
MHIIGAGMAGCIAAILNPTAQILEGAPERPDNHKAVLRFRTREISNLTGIEFETIKVYKSIYYKGLHYSECNPMFANMYSAKVVGKISNRSIWNLDCVERFLAPSDFHKRLLERLESEGRVTYGEKITHISDTAIHTTEDIFERKGGIISTAPIGFMPKITGINFKESVDFGFKNILTIQGIVKDSNVHQTIYYPEVEFPIYRATLTGCKIIVEFKEGDWSEYKELYLIEVLKSFGLYEEQVEFEKDFHIQKFGKISPINEDLRKRYIFDLTDVLEIYSLGRFAIWKNILLDDVLDDLYTIQKLIQSNSYDRKKIRAK